MYNLSEIERKEVEKLEKELFFSNGVLRYTKEEVENNTKLQMRVLRLQNLYSKMEELHFASYN
jgi:hypothetical protein